MSQLLRNRQFLLLWLVNNLTVLANELFAVTILVGIFQQTGSTLQAAGAMVTRSLPAFLLGPIAGVLVDRFRRKNVLIAMDLLRLILIAGTIWLLREDGNIPVAAIYVVMTLLAAADTFHRPARIALVPSLVPQEQLVSANGFIQTSTMIMMAISYALGGWLILRFPLAQIGIAEVVLFAIAIGFALLMVVPRREQDSAENDPSDSFWQAITSGWRYLNRHPIARPLTIMETIEHLPHGIWTGAIMLAFTIQALNGDAADWGYQTTGYFSGMIVGSIAAMAFSERLSRYPGRIIVITAAMVGFLTLLYASSQSVLIAAAVAFLFGPPFAIRDVAQDSLLQSTVDENQLGRVYATREMLRNLVFMFAGLFFAWLSDIVPVRSIYMIGGVMYLLTGLYAISNKALRESSMSTSLEATS